MSSDSDSRKKRYHRHKRLRKTSELVQVAQHQQIPGNQLPNETLIQTLVTALNRDKTPMNMGPHMQGAQNVISEFDPISKSQTMEDWLSKINESAAVYGWSERQTIFYTLPKLTGLAKKWYDGLTSVKFSWIQWQEKLLEAFPCDENYGDILWEILNRKSRKNETLVEYYYDKIMLINRCKLQNKQAVDCITHGIYDFNIKMNVQGAHFEYFSSSVKRWDLLKKYVLNLTLKPLSETRWSSRIDAIKPLCTNLPDIYDALYEISNDISYDQKTKYDAKCLAGKICTFSFICSLNVWHIILTKVNFVSKILQSVNMNMQVALDALTELKKFLLKIRTDIHFEEIEGILIPTMPPSLLWTTSRMETIPRYPPGKPGNPTPATAVRPHRNLGEDTNLFSTAPSARAAAIAPTTPAASIAPNDTNTAATNAPNTLLQSAPTMNCWQQLIVEKSRTNNPDNDITNPRQASLSAELRALALQRKSIDARLNDRQTPGNEGGHGGPDPIPPDEVRRLRKKRGKITARERKLLNRLRDIRAGASQRDAQTDAGAAVRDQRQVREEETQREKPLTAPEPTAPADRNRADSDGERPRRQKRRGKWAGQTHREFLATNTLPPRTSEPQPGPSGLGAMKTSRPDETASPSALQGEPKRVRVQSSQGEQKTYAQATKDILARLAVAICFTPPAQNMTPNQGERVQAEIERLIMESDSSTTLPAFRGYPRMADGTVHMWCENEGPDCRGGKPRPRHKAPTRPDNHNNIDKLEEEMAMAAIAEREIPTPEPTGWRELLVSSPNDGLQSMEGDGLSDESGST
ncbi:hypothetical protein ACJJTC_013101 [Scirpophaga incertulas]